MKTFRLHMSLLLLIALTSCGPKEEYVFLGDFEKSIFDHPVGSWWVYVNDSTGEVDTVRLVEKLHRFEDYNEDSKYKHYYEYIGKTLTSQKFNLGYGYGLEARKDCPGGTFFIILPDDYIFAGMYSPVECSYLPHYETKLHDLLVIDSFTFSNVYETVDYDCKIEDSDTSHIFVSPGVGLIKWYLTNSDTAWSLVEYDIK